MGDKTAENRAKRQAERSKNPVTLAQSLFKFMYPGPWMASTMTCVLTSSIMASFATNTPWSPRCLLAAVCAAFIQGASNIFNQLYDLEIDKINKPDRPIVAGIYSPLQAKIFVGFQAVMAFWSFWYCSTQGFIMLCIVALGIIMYSVPPFHFKNSMFGSVIWLGFVREYVGHIAGWALTANVLASGRQPFLFGIPHFIYMAGVISVKDLSDIKGDREEGIKTIAVVYGPDACARIVRPFWMLPWVGLAVMCQMGLLDVDANFVSVWCFLGLLWGFRVAQNVIKSPEEIVKTGEKFHPAFYHAYYLSMFMNWGLVIGYYLKAKHINLLALIKF